MRLFHARCTQVLPGLFWRLRRPAVIWPGQAKDKDVMKEIGNEVKRHDDQMDGNR